MIARPLKGASAHPREVRLRHFSIALMPIAMFLIYGLITDHFIARGLDIPAEIVETGRPWLEAAGRYRFLAASWLFSSLAILAIALLVGNLLRPTTRQTRLAAIGVLLLILVLAMAPTLHHLIEPAERATGSGRGVYRHIGPDVFEAVLGQGTLPGCSGPNDTWLLGRCGDLPVVTMFRRVLDLVNMLAGLAVGTLIVGMILCLDSGGGETMDEKAEVLAENLRQLRHQLYLSSLVLSFGMLFATSWMNWPLGMIVESERDAYGSVLMSTALFTGTYFSMLILSFFLPVALILDSRVRNLAKAKDSAVPKGETFDIDTWLESSGLKEGAGEYMRAGLAIIAPVLTSFTGGISPLGI